GATTRSTTVWTLARNSSASAVGTESATVKVSKPPAVVVCVRRTLRPPGGAYRTTRGSHRCGLDCPTGRTSQRITGVARAAPRFQGHLARVHHHPRFNRGRGDGCPREAARRFVLGADRSRASHGTSGLPSRAAWDQ